ncbi:ABC transporter ATP-binding protein [Ralstonia solanacearum]|uniref:ABC transporter ATP-binding protein n=2 Tax=Ralstonia solanacearum TaxID=305 RepID=A0AAW5ZJQ6_RALSL|nr:ABC transporter ATP-binding protein [Ralstonia solanacearum]ATJ88699.1 ABC transporter ATP-binding protein [Ralstonia solanacearum]MDB0509509.1 ABC transporter ATP-binding protein [Ralstonia solanacearum]MDB0515441.1 ABC transporter ATP-binding protein [Ralstonia solanacearum]MDB0569877.1 ABC transporter ATP-binding protein [Ralstonia solanacearum]OAI63253.1 ABC transporter [Ralstonia solanacearum]
MGASVVVEGLHITAGEQTLVDHLSFAIQPGEVLALIGESGSGKTTTALALMGYARQGCSIAGGSVRIGEVDVLHLDPARQRALRGRTVAYIAQSAAASFNPSRTIMDQVVEPACIHGTMKRAEAQAKAVQLFHELALPDPDTIGERYPHQVSGGQLQRLMAAMALITDPDLVILDEPTTALDVTTQIEVLRAFRRVVRERRATAVYVSHDLAVVAQMADHILVLRGGQMQELNPTAHILATPDHDYTRSLLAAARPTARPAQRCKGEGELLLDVRELAAGYGPVDAKGRPATLILEDINFKLYRGQAIGVIGESGSGKTTLARAIAGLIAPSHGSMMFADHALKPLLANRTRDELRRIQIVFQMADTALNPSQTIERILARPLQFYKGLKGEALQRRIRELLDLVRLPHTVAQRLPGGLSGGQKQRVNLARALAAEPDLILCDEVTSALDTVVGAAVLDLMADLRRELGVSYLFISHDLHTVRAVCDEIVVMQHGRKLTQVARADYDRGPHHPYYEQLAASVPELRQGWLDEKDRAAVLST